MSWTSPLTVASTIVPLPSSSDFSMCGSRWATDFFITSAEASTNGSCIWPEPNSSPTVFMPASRSSLTMSSAGLDANASSRSSVRPLSSASTMRRWRRSPSGSAFSSSARAALVSAVVTPSNNSRKRASGS